MPAERLQKILSAYGIASRRAAEAMIKDGRVSVNCEVASLGSTADPEVDSIKVDGNEIAVKMQKVYLLLNKPRGFLTTVSDDRGRKTVMELVYDVGVRIYPVGRLDINSEGLLIFTNDGDFANKLMHPSNEKVKTYEVHITGNVTEAVELLKKPVSISENDNTQTVVVKAAGVEVISQGSKEAVIRISIIEGRNRQIRKMCTACGVKVLSLKRISIDSIELGNIESGKWRYLTEKEVKLLG